MKHILLTDEEFKAIKKSLLLVIDILNKSNWESLDKREETLNVKK